MAVEVKPIKIVLLGNSGVGKSELISRYHSNEFKNEFVSTIGVEFVTKTVFLGNGKSIKALLVYDVTNPRSFQGLEMWRKNSELYSDRNCVNIVCGNKSDLDAIIEPHEGKAYADDHGMGFQGTSAKTGEGVNNAFLSLAQQILDMQAGSTSRENQQETLRLSDGRRGRSASSACC